MGWLVSVHLRTFNCVTQHSFDRLKFYIRQQCAAAILRVLEGYAESGLTCRLKNIRNDDVRRLLFPKLVSMNFDQPEAQLFFGIQNQKSCSKCRWRRGYSAFRKSTTQKGTVVHRLYGIANTPTSEHKGDAQDKLKRWGFNHERRCCLTDVCNKLLVRIPGVDEVYPCVDYRDGLHGLMMFISGQIRDAMDSIPLTGRIKTILDQRLARLGTMRSFRDPSGQAYRVQKTIFSDKGLTAKDKVCVLFFLPHVLGHTADIIPHVRLRVPLLTAISRAQLIIIAARGLRSYTVPELEEIYDRGYVELFGCLEYIRAEIHRIRCELHATQPRRYKKEPTLFTPKDKYPCSDTDDTDSDSEVGGHSFYSHGDKCLVHQHWVMQVVSAGGFNVHCTQSAESAHKISAKLASLRVRHLHSNKTKSSMLQYLCFHNVFEDMIKTIPSFETRDHHYTAPSPGVRVPLLNDDGTTFTLHTGARFDSRDFQNKFIHREVLLTKFEFMDLLCAQFGLPLTIESYSILERLVYSFGQKLICSECEIFWATDTQYPYDTSCGSRRRRDILAIEGLETHVYTLGDGSNIRKANALCGECICFVTVSDISFANLTILNASSDLTALQSKLKSTLESAMVNDSVTFVLVRWFEPKDTLIRDGMGRPICPGPLKVNHCLWRYAETSNVRRSMFSRAGRPTRSFLKQRQLFKDHDIEQHKYAYYGLIHVSNVMGRVNMTPEFITGTSFPDTTTWLQSVTLI